MGVGRCAIHAESDDFHPIHKRFDLRIDVHKILTVAHKTESVSGITGTADDLGKMAVQGRFTAGKDHGVESVI